MEHIVRHSVAQVNDSLLPLLGTKAETIVSVDMGGAARQYDSMAQLSFSDSV